MIKKLCLLCALSVFVSTPVMAQLVVTKLNDVDFGQVEFDATANGQIRLGTNGSVTVTGSGLSTDGLGSAGRVSITSDPGDVIEVRCRRSPDLTTSNGDFLNISRMQASVDVGVAYNNATICDNLGASRNPVAVIDMSVNPDPVILLGGRVIVNPGTLASGTYLASNPGARIMRVRVTIQ